MPPSITTTKVRVQLVALPQLTGFVDVTELLSTLGALGVAGRIVVVERTSNFQVAVAVQTYDSDPEVCNTPTRPSDLANLNTDFKAAVNKWFYKFDPTNANKATSSARRDSGSAWCSPPATPTPPAGR